jgi:excisionase family DNA binding protein
MDKAADNSSIADGRVAYAVNDLADALGIGRTKLYSEIASGRLQAKKLGSRTLIPADAVRAYLAQLPDVKAA